MFIICGILFSLVETSFRMVGLALVVVVDGSGAVGVVASVVAGRLLLLLF